MFVEIYLNLWQFIIMASSVDQTPIHSLYSVSLAWVMKATKFPLQSDEERNVTNWQPFFSVAAAADAVSWSDKIRLRKQIIKNEEKFTKETLKCFSSSLLLSLPFFW